MDFCPINVFRDGEPEDGNWPKKWKRKPDRRPHIQLDASDPDHAAMLSLVVSGDLQLVGALEREMRRLPPEMEAADGTES